jgi:D-isomer specific 2-hydroxyacid dehydrogenase, NAD binding domain
VVDEVALIATLRGGRIAAAGIDVYDDEPPAPDHPLFGLDQVILTPHIAGLTAECSERMAISSVQNVLDFFEGKIDPALVVNGDHLNGSWQASAEINLIDTGFTGKLRVFGFAAARHVFDLPYELILQAVADQTEEMAARAAHGR